MSEPKPPRFRSLYAVNPQLTGELAWCIYCGELIDEGNSTETLHPLPDAEPLRNQCGAQTVLPLRLFP